MTLVAERSTRVRVVEFEIELVTGRWRLAPSCVDVLGVEAALLSSRNAVVAVMHPDDRDVTARAISQALAGPRSFSYDSRVVRSDGQLRTVRAAGAFSSALDGMPRGMVGTVTALSEWETPIFVPPLKPGGSEGDLAVAMLARVKDAHSYAFSQYAGVVARAAGTILRDCEQIEDVVQAVFEALWRNPSRFDPNRGSLAAFLQVQARSRSLDLLRSEASRAERARRYCHEVERVTSDGGGHSMAVLKLDIARALARLPATERAPLELAFFGHLSYRDVALSLGVAEGTVKGRIRSGLSRLRSGAGLEALLG